MMKKKSVTNKTFLLTAVIGSLLLMAMVTANSIWASKQTISATDEAVSAVSSFYLETMADRRARMVTNQIDSSFNQMEKALVYIKEEGIESQEELRDMLGKIKDLLSLNGFALVNEDNIVYTQYTTYTGGSRHSFLSEGKLEERTISTVSLYGSSKQLCLAVPTPGLTIMGKPFKACFVQIDMKDIVDLLALDDQGGTYFAVYSKKGGNLSGTELGPAVSTRNILEATKNLVSEEVWKENVDNFSGEARGDMSFSYGGVRETLSYVPIQGTGWELAVLIHESVILDQIRGISEKNLAVSRNQIAFTLCAVLMLCFVLLQQLRSLTRGELEAQKEVSRAFLNIATTDSLTGVRNKYAYTELEAAIDEKIRSKEIEKLAVAVCDINGLKEVNDTRGHAAGDKLIKDACALICEYFSHGAVFRIGGDEFEVVVQGEHCDTLDEVICALNRKVESNIKEKAVVVSVGCSMLQPDDRCLHDVSHRADQLMYKRKKELKDMGANSR